MLASWKSAAAAFSLAPSPIISNLCSGAVDLLTFGDRLAIDLWQEEDHLRHRHNRCTKRAQSKDATRYDQVAPPEICGECCSEMDQNPEQGEAHCPCCGAIVTTEFGGSRRQSKQTRSVDSWYEQRQSFTRQPRTILRSIDYGVWKEYIMVFQRSYSICSRTAVPPKTIFPLAFAFCTSG